MSELSDRQEKLFADFLAPRKILIADSYGASRSGLAKIIVAMGAKPGNLTLIDNYVDGMRMVQSLQPEVLIVDYSLGNSNGLDLSEETKTYKNRDDKLFVLVTGNSSQSAVAQAAEEDVDVFILKPYTIKGFTEILMRTVLAKIYPSDYIKAIQAGKKLLEANETDAAVLEFDKAVTLNEKPTLAYYYQAQAKLMKDLFTEAEKSYNSGLQVNNLHYKCLTGVFDLLIKQKRNTDAYAVVKQLARFFPANPNRLGQVLSLAINTGNYADVEQYYETFKEIEVRNDDLVRYVCASLVVCGKHFFRQHQKDKALEFLKKASVSAAGKPLILREIITVLVDNKLLPEAEDVLKRFPDDIRKDSHFLVASFLVRNLSEGDKAKLIPDLRNMVRDEIKEPLIWYWLIYHLVDYKKTDEAETICDEAIKLWPAKEAYFRSALRAVEEEEEEEDDDE
jgi:tetratricopeptide (TPR) repeat protein